MRNRNLYAAVAVYGVALWGLVAVSPAAAACQIQQFAELQVEPGSGAPLIKTQVNGQPVLLTANTGTNVTFLSRTAAVKLGLRPKSLIGVDAYSHIGALPIQDVTIGNFQIGSLRMKDYDVFVIDDKISNENISGEIGGSMLFTNDVDFDLPEHVIRLVKPVGCRGAEVVFWNKAYSMARLTGFDENVKQFFTTVSINGHNVEALIDTGSEASVLSYGSAAALGLKLTLKPSKVRKDEEPSGLPTYTGKIDSFGFGDEIIMNTNIQVDAYSRGKVPDETGSRLGVETTPSNLVLGADFFRSHRVLIAKSQNMLYFSYMGGPVFDLTASAKSKPSSQGGTIPSEATAPH